MQSDRGMIEEGRGGRSRMLRRMKRGSAASISAYRQCPPCLFQPRVAKRGSSRVPSSCTVSITASKSLAAGHRIESHTHYNGSSGEGIFCALEPYVTISFFQLHSEQFKLDDGKHLPRKDTHFLNTRRQNYNGQRSVC